MKIGFIMQAKKGLGFPLGWAEVYILVGRVTMSFPSEGSVKFINNESWAV